MGVSAHLAGNLMASPVQELTQDVLRVVGDACYGQQDGVVGKMDNRRRVDDASWICGELNDNLKRSAVQWIEYDACVCCLAISPRLRNAIMACNTYRESAHVGRKLERRHGGR